jgi:hypothetical protein
MSAERHEGLTAVAPARPNLGTSLSSLTTMLRSASLAAFEMRRVCWWAPAPSVRRATRRTHDEHWGRSGEALSEAMVEGVGGAGLQDEGRGADAPTNVKSEALARMRGCVRADLAAALLGAS